MAGLVRLCENSSPLSKWRKQFYADGQWSPFSVVAGLVPAIHDFNPRKFRKAWMAGTSPAMTVSEQAGYTKKLILHPSPKSAFSHGLLVPATHPIPGTRPGARAGCGFAPAAHITKPFGAYLPAPPPEPVDGDPAVVAPGPVVGFVLPLPFIPERAVPAVPLR
jgi:hypothetical protein